MATRTRTRAGRSAVSTIKLDLDVDERTGKMSDEALFCRTHGHKWELQGQSSKDFMALLKQGLREWHKICEHGCGSSWKIIWKIRTGEIVSTSRVYPKGDEYKAPKGTGRIHRQDARVAQFAREYAAYA